jgi:hypothetical protein
VSNLEKRTYIIVLNQVRVVTVSQAGDSIGLAPCTVSPLTDGAVVESPHRENINVRNRCCFDAERENISMKHFQIPSFQMSAILRISLGKEIIWPMYVDYFITRQQRATPLEIAALS